VRCRRAPTRCPALRPPTRSAPFPSTTLFRPAEAAEPPTNGKRAASSSVPEDFGFVPGVGYGDHAEAVFAALREAVRLSDGIEVQDRKSTRLNSSHVKISYAVFCLKKKIELELGCSCPCYGFRVSPWFSRPSLPLQAPLGSSARRPAPSSPRADRAGAAPTRRVSAR